MDRYMLFILLELSFRDLPVGVVREFLGQSLLACEERNWERMFEMAQEAKTHARAQGNRVAEAAALIHLGLALWQMDRFEDARSLCNRAKRMFHRDPDWRQRMGEGLAAFALGLIHEQRPEAVRHFEEALKLLKRLVQGYAAEGNLAKQAEIGALCEVLHLKVSGQTPIIFLDGKAHVMSSPAGRNEPLLDLQPDVEYRIIRIEKGEYKEFGLSSDDSVLVRRITQVREIVPGGLGLWYEADGEHTVGMFDRDAQGNIQFIQPGAQPRVIGDLNLDSIDYVEAFLKPA